MNAEMNTPEGDELDILTTLVESHEAKHFAKAHLIIGQQNKEISWLKEETERLKENVLPNRLKPCAVDS
jgi:hypothetical protein